MNLKEMAVEFQDKIKFKIVFAFVVLDSNAWLNHPRRSKFHHLYLIFYKHRTSIITQEQKMSPRFS